MTGKERVERATLESLSANLRDIAHVFEGKAISIEQQRPIVELLTRAMEMTGKSAELVRQYNVFEKTLAASFTDHAKNARELRERIEEVLAQIPAEPVR